MKAVLLGAALLFAPLAQASTLSFMPENRLQYAPQSEMAGGLTEAQFNAVIDHVETIYKPLFAQHGATLTVERLWNDETVNAFADQPSDTDWEVHMFGGLARRPEVTEDGFAMVICHELGHHLGGFPFVSSTDWAANEGQADMHATGACASKVFTPNPALELQAQLTIPANLKEKCDLHHTNAQARGVCYRAIAAGKSLGDLLGALEGHTVSFDTPDTSVVTVTNNDHPAAQCRLDTYVASALCGNVFWDYSLIPGKSQADRSSLAAQQEAFAHSCEGSDTARPRCWFAPL